MSHYEEFRQRSIGVNWNLLNVVEQFSKIYTLTHILAFVFWISYFSFFKYLVQPELFALGFGLSVTQLSWLFFRSPIILISSQCLLLPVAFLTVYPSGSPVAIFAYAYFATGTLPFWYMGYQHYKITHPF